MKEKSCGAIVLKEENNETKALIIKSINNIWSYPKGHMAENETEIETAIREVKEETGLDIEIDESFRKVMTYSPKENVIKDVVLFIGKPLNNDIKIDPNEVLDYKWVSIYELNSLFNHQDIIDVTNSLIGYLEENKIMI